MWRRRCGRRSRRSLNIRSAAHLKRALKRRRITMWEIADVWHGKNADSIVVIIILFLYRLVCLRNHGWPPIFRVVSQCHCGGFIFIDIRRYLPIVCIRQQHSRHLRTDFCCAIHFLRKGGWFRGKSSRGNRQFS
jgi:hypothetical protein